MILKFFLPFALIISGCNSVNDSASFDIRPESSYPRWLLSGNYRTDQTSGITYIGLDEAKKKVFILADDIGKMHHLRIEKDTLLHISPISFSDQVKKILLEYPKPDFEEVVYDKYTGKVYLSIEGNAPDPARYTSIYEVFFSSNNPFSDSVTHLKKIAFQPDSLFRKYISNNIAYEGFAVDENYFYLGLEGFSEKGIFADSTVIFIADKETKTILKQINTGPISISTVCGLYSDENHSVWGIDRNSKKLFHIKLKDDLSVSSVQHFEIETTIPDYPKYNYVAALEAVTFDDDNFIYLVDDPWKTFFIPSDDVIRELDSQTVSNFKNFIPVIYRYKLIKKK